MVHESIGGGETGAQLVSAFRSIVGRAVAPQLAAREKGLSEIVMESDLAGRTRVVTGSMRIDFNCYESSPEEQPGSRAYRYEVGIQEMTPSGEYRAGATFGVLDEERIGRNLRVNTEGMLSLRGVSRALDGEESHALLDYIIAPHLDDGARLALVMRTTPEEDEVLAAEAGQADEQRKRFYEQLGVSAAARQQGATNAVRITNLTRPGRRDL